MLVNLRTSTVKCSGGSRGGVRGARAPLLFLDQIEARPKGRKSCLGRPPPPPPYLRVWLTASPTPLISRSGSGTEVKPVVSSSVHSHAVPGGGGTATYGLYRYVPL